MSATCRSIFARRTICALIVWAATAPARALEIQDARWGFDGEVVPERFNLLSVLVANDSSAPFDGAIDLFKTRGGPSRVGALEEQPCYLAPFTARWVQFYPYIEQENFEWMLTWGRDRKTLQAPRLGPPGTVVLSEADTLAAKPGSVKLFLDELFPTTVSGAAGLHALLLDYAPRWPAAKRLALRDWLRGGGTVHLLQNANGEFPVFTEELAVLNTTADRMPVGAGQIIRHPATRRSVSESFLSSQGFAAPQLTDNQQTSIWNFGQTLFQSLAVHARARHNWALIYLCTVLYIGVSGPGALLLSRRVRDYRIVLGVVITSVIGFSMLFSVIGQRGQGEQSMVHTLSYARSLGDRQFDVTQWIQVFVTHGGNYTFRHAASHGLYTVGGDYEAVNGVAHNGKDGSFVVDMPVFSQRAIVHQGLMTGDDVTFEPVAWREQGRLQEFAVQTDREFSTRISEMWAVRGRTVYPMYRLDNRWRLAGTGETFEEFFRADKMQTFNTMAYRMPGENATPQFTPAELSKFVRPLMAYALNGAGALPHSLVIPEVSSDPARVQLFFLAPSPASFALAGKGFGHEAGYTLYHVTLQKPGGNP